MDTFSHPKEIWNKIHREASRAYNSKDLTDIKDHILNFCITSHSLRDWCIKHLGLPNSEKDQFHNECNKFDFLKYCRDIANSTKHFGLDSGKSSCVKELVHNNTQYSRILPNGNIHSEFEQESYYILIDEANRVDLLMFFFKVQEAWESIFSLYDVDKSECVEKGVFAITFTHPSLL